MPLQLKAVEVSRGARWVGDGLRVFARRPFQLTLLLVLYLAAGTLLAALVPFVGSLVQLMSLPLLSLGFMLATHSALLGGPVHPGQFVEPLRGDAKKRRALLILCASYGALALALLLLCGWISNDALARLQTLMAQGAPNDQARTQIEAILSEPGLTQAALAFSVLGTALSVPYWFAPALVHWAGQGVGQALFSSTLAMWRNKGAFFAFMATWMALVGVLSVSLSVVLALVGAGRVAPLLLMPVALVFTTVFYASQLFAFNDCFGGVTPRGGRAGDEPPPTTVP
jgi:hypothetical protein